MITLTNEDWEAIQQQIQALQQQVTDLTALQERAQAELDAAQARITELAGKKTPPPGWAKANTPACPKTDRKKRAPEQNHARCRETPTQVVQHVIHQCPQCQGQLSGLHVGRRRQVIEVPPPPPVEVIEHQVQRGWCSYCRQWREAPLDLSGQVVGQGRIGVRLAALLAHLRLVVRAPIRVIRQWLASVHQVSLSVGAIVDVLRRLAEQGRREASALRETIRRHPQGHADETTWRENGRNGYIWALSPPVGNATLSIITARRER